MAPSRETWAFSANSLLMIFVSSVPESEPRTLELGNGWHEAYPAWLNSGNYAISSTRLIDYVALGTDGANFAASREPNSMHHVVNVKFCPGGLHRSCTGVCQSWPYAWCTDFHGLCIVGILISRLFALTGNWCPRADTALC